MNLRVVPQLTLEERAAKAREQAAKGERYKAWLEGEGLGDTLDKLKAQYLDRATQFSIKKPARAIRLIEAAAIVDMVRKHIELEIKGGNVATQELREIELIRTGKKREFF